MNGFPVVHQHVVVVRVPGAAAYASRVQEHINAVRVA